MTPRSEYPRPQFKRSAWLNLNGQWQFEIDHGDSGRARGLLEKETLEREITVPFCPESRLSGIGSTDFMKAVWYKRSFTLPRQAEGRRVFIHFGAVDYATEVWINGQPVLSVKGFTTGYAAFSVSAERFAAAARQGDNVLAVKVVQKVGGQYFDAGLSVDVPKR